MTKLTPEAIAAVARVEKKWDTNKETARTLRKELNEKLEREVTRTLAKARVELAVQVKLALESGATKISLRRVTSMNPGTIEELLALIEEPTEETATERPIGDALTCEWIGDDLVQITVDPQAVSVTTFDRDDPALWSGPFEVFNRGDGKTLIFPVESAPTAPGAAVAAWLLDAPANEGAVIAWTGSTRKAA